MSTNPSDSHQTLDLYEVLQINPNAEIETIHRIYRLLAQRFHPDNKQTGDDIRFQALQEAYHTLRDPDRRAHYDIGYQEIRRRKWRATSADVRAGDEFELEEVTRLTVLEVLYAQRRAEPHSPGIFVLDFEDLTGRPREHLEFTMWYLVQKQLVKRGDNSRYEITVEGVDYFEKHQRDGLLKRRLTSGEEASDEAS